MESDSNVINNLQRSHSVNNTCSATKKLKSGSVEFRDKVTEKWPILGRFEHPYGVCRVGQK